LEEPPPNTVIILIGTAEQRQLPTIRSRCQIVRFAPLHWEEVQQILVQKDLVGPPDMAERLARSSGGSVQSALHLFGDDVLDFRAQWLERLASISVTEEGFIKSLHGFVERAGKEATPKRRRLIEVAAWAAEYFRQTLAVLANGGQPPALRESPDQELARLTIAGAKNWTGTLESMAIALDRCLMVESQVMANAHLVTLTESWLLDLNQAAIAKVPFYPSLATVSPLAQH
jgi:DNA polymerase-3 subunit delta'